MSRFACYRRNIFIADLQSCEGVICNAGFNVPSEAIHFGKKILVKPLKGQYEQESNAQALLELNLGSVMHKLDHNALSTWLNKKSPAPLPYPNVAGAISNWLLEGNMKDPTPLVKSLWKNTPYALTVSV